MTMTNHPGSPDSEIMSTSEWPMTPGAWVSVLSMGAFVGIDNVIFSIAIGNLLFSGPLASGVGLAVTVSIISTLIAGVLIGFFSQIKCNVGHVQDLGVAVLAQAIAVSVATQALPEEVRVATAVVIVTLTTLVSAVLLWVTGALGWGGIVRFFPQSVLAGFLAGTGWLMTAGGLSVATSLPIFDLFRPEFYSRDVALMALPSLFFGFGTFVILRRTTFKGALIACMIAGVAGFHLLLWLTKTPISQAQSMGWLPIPNAEAAGTPNLLKLVGMINWDIVALALPAVATAAFLTLIGTLLNTSALSAIGNQDVDADRELRLHGLVNLAIAPFAGPPAHTGIASSLMTMRAGVATRGVGIVLAAIALLSLFNVTTLTAIVPNFVTAGLIIYLGLDFLYDWLILTWRTYSRSEWSVVVVVLAIVILVGFAEAIVAGLMIASLIFAWHYASVPVLRRTGSLRDRSSTLARAPAEVAWLRTHGDQVEVIELQGFMFFGTAERLFGHIRRRIADKTRPPLTRLIIDFQHVVGLDAAAAVQLTRIVSAAAQHSFQLVFSGYPRDVLATLTRAAPALLEEGGALGLPTLDEAIEAAEDAVLALATVKGPVPTLLQRLDPAPADLPHLERLFAALPQESHIKGSVIMFAGTTADSLVFLEAGRVAVRVPSSKGHGPRLRSMSSGAILGDIGLALRATRTADVVAETDVVFRRLSLGDMERIEATDPPLNNALHRLQRRSLAERFVFDERLAATVPVSGPE